MDEKVFNTKGVDIDQSELKMAELPLIDSSIEEIITEAGGKTGDYPNVRIVSGLDPNITEFIGGKEWRVYAFREHYHKTVYLYTEAGKETKILTEKEAGIITNSKKHKGIIIPKKITDVVERGIPRYFVEIYRPAEHFGSEEQWNKIRYDKDENDNWIDLMGDFPHEGRYETWFCIEEAVEDKDGKVIKTRFKEIDDVALSFILQKIEEVKQNKLSMAERHIQMLEEENKEKQVEVEKAKENIKDIVADRIDRITGTVKSYMSK